MRIVDMFSPSAAGSPWACLCLVSALLTSGCQRSENVDPPAAARPATPRPLTTAQPADAPRPSRAVEAPVVVSQPNHDLRLPEEDLGAEVQAPEVLLSEDHRATCRIQVGDQFPDVTVTSLDDQPTSLQSLLGPRLTIVVFWSARQPMSLEQIRHLQDEFAGRYRDAGVAVVTINVGDSTEDVRGLLDNIDGSFANFCDPNRQAFAEVATGLLPRTYLLGPDRSVIWFDLEYSRSARRELRNAILYALRQSQQRAANSGGQSLM